MTVLGVQVCTLWLRSLHHGLQLSVNEGMWDPQNNSYKVKVLDSFHTTLRAEPHALQEFSLPEVVSDELAFHFYNQCCIEFKIPSL